MTSVFSPSLLPASIVDLESKAAWSAHRGRWQRLRACERLQNAHSSEYAAEQNWLDQVLRVPAWSERCQTKSYNGIELLPVTIDYWTVFAHDLWRCGEILKAKQSGFVSVSSRPSLERTTRRPVRERGFVGGIEHAGAVFGAARP